MKNLITFISIMLCFCFILSPLSFAEEAEPRDIPAEKSVLNVSAISEEQAELCAAVMLDGFEAEETERTPAEGTLPSLSVSALEGEKCMRLFGNGSAGMTLTLKKRRTTANARSLCVCAFVEPTGEDAEYVISVTVNGTEKTVSGSSDIPAGQWCAAYLPIDTNETVEIESVTVAVSEKNGGNVRISCLIDRVHTAVVDGLPDRLKYFASDFTANRAQIEYKDDALIYRPLGSNSYIESTACGYMTNGEYNALSVKLENNSSAEKITLQLKLDKQYSYTEENSHTLTLLPGEHTYNFPIGGFRFGTTVAAFRLQIPGDAEGEIAVKSIGFSSYRFPAEYAGTVTAATKGDKLTVSGTMPNYPASSTRICLYRLTPGFDEEEPGGLDAEPYAEAPPSSSFSFELPVKDGENDNTYFKYLVRYETKSGYEDAGVAYADRSKAVKPSVQYKGTEATEDKTLLSYLTPGTVYVDVNLGELLSADGDVEFSFAKEKGRMSGAALAVYDALIERCAANKTSVVIRFVYSPFADVEKYCFINGSNILPDITTTAGAAHYMSLLSFFAQRYGNKVSAVIPCGALSAAETAKMRGITVDKAEKYYSDLIFAAQSVLWPYKTAVIAPVSPDDAVFFAGMLEKDVTAPETLPLFISVNSAEEAEKILFETSESGFGVILCCRVNGASEFARLYYGCRGAFGLCVRGISKIDGCAELFSVIDTTAGIAAADRLASEAFPYGVAAEYPDISAPVKIYIDKERLLLSQLPRMITALYDGSDVSGWNGSDSCKSIYSDTVNGESAAGLSFDYSVGCFGSASFLPEKTEKYEKVYFRLYADYLPEDVTNIKLRISAEGERGITSGYCVLTAEDASVIVIEPDASIGRVKKFTLSPLDVPDGATPRICVLGIYTEGSDSSETITEAQTETMPEPESQIFETAEITVKEDAEGSRTQLYIIAICVIIGMFAVCGVIIFVLKLRDRRKERGQKTDGPTA